MSASKPKSPLHPALAGVERPVIGMLHLAALPGAPRYAGDMHAVLQRALRDAEALLAGGVHGLLLENFGDAPFHRGRASRLTVAHLTRLAMEVRRQSATPLGINVLRNDGCSALAIADAVAAEFIRVNVLCGAVAADQGVIQGIAARLMRLRSALRSSVRVLADVDVKHAAPLGAPQPIEQQVHDTEQRGLADGVIVSGSGTGQPVELDALRRVALAARTPVWVGSGVTAQNCGTVLPFADGLIVGSALKVDGIASNPVDPERLREFMAAYRAASDGLRSRQARSS